MSETLPVMVHRIASVLDHPSVYMGGPSHDSIRKARAVLEALREPTEEMVEAGTAAIQAEGLADVATVDGWRAMISTALKDSE